MRATRAARRLGTCKQNTGSVYDKIRAMAQAAREAILAAIKKSLGAKSREPVSRRQLPLQPTAAADLAAQFCAELARVGGRAHVAESAAAARDLVVEIARACSARSALVWSHPLLEAAGIPDALADVGIEVIREDGGAPENFRASALAADLGITACDHALADTGTLVLLAKPGQARGASLLPPAHIALLERHRILASLDELMLRLRKEPELSSCLTLITGPSRTGDIELVLSVGVHGPRELHAVLLGER